MHNADKGLYLKDFVKWWGSASVKAVERAKKLHPRKLAYRLRRLNGKGGFHEWFMVKHIVKFAEWGATAKNLIEMTQAIKELNKVAKGWKHGGTGSKTFHDNLSRIISSSKNLRDFKRRVRIWADDILKNGIDDLPKFFQ